MFFAVDAVVVILLFVLSPLLRRSTCTKLHHGENVCDRHDWRAVGKTDHDRKPSHRQTIPIVCHSPTFGIMISRFLGGKTPSIFTERWGMIVCRKIQARFCDRFVSFDSQQSNHGQFHGGNTSSYSSLLLLLPHNQHIVLSTPW
jgi:hypothetical protein